MEQEPGVFVLPEPGTRILRVIRNEVPFANVTDLLRVLDEIEHQLASVDRSVHSLLIDTRRVPPRTDPEFEAAFRHWRERLVKGFVKTAVLVSTDTGRAQAERYAVQDGVQLQVFSDEQAALDWLA